MQIMQLFYIFNTVTGPYWIGYDDLDSIRLKSQFINYRNLGGALIFSLDTDDFRADFSDHKYPMTMVRRSYGMSRSFIIIFFRRFLEFCLLERPWSLKISLVKTTNARQQLDVKKFIEHRLYS